METSRVVKVGATDYEQSTATSENKHSSGELALNTLSIEELRHHVETNPNAIIVELYFEIMPFLRYRFAGEDSSILSDGVLDALRDIKKVMSIADGPAKFIALCKQRAEWRTLDLIDSRATRQKREISLDDDGADHRGTALPEAIVAAGIQEAKLRSLGRVFKLSLFASC